MGNDIKRKIFFLTFFSPSGKYQVMMLCPSHNSVIEAEACVAAGFSACITGTLPLPSHLGVLPLSYNPSEVVTCMRSYLLTYWCRQVSPLWSALMLCFLKRSSTIWEHGHKHCWGATRQPQPCHYINLLQLTYSWVERVEVWKGCRWRGKARKDKRGSAPPQLAKSVLWFRQVQRTAAGDSAGQGKRLKKKTAGAKYHCTLLLVGAQWLWRQCLVYE